MTRKGPALNRSLDFLLSANNGKKQDDTNSVPVIEQQLALDVLQRGQYQPRQDMSPEALQDLADSITQQGIIQPIIVRPVSQDRYEIIAGERRWRAARLAGLTQVPVLIRDVSDESAIAMALIENLQREDLNPLEEAIALQRLIDEFDLSHQKAAEAVGKSRSMVSNLLRLLSLEPDVKRCLERGDLEMGHARALLSLSGEEQVNAANLVIERSLNVRETERLVHRLQKPSPAAAPVISDPQLDVFASRLSNCLNTDVEIQAGKHDKGKLVIRYRSANDLQRILETIDADLPNSL